MMDIPGHRPNRPHKNSGMAHWSTGTPPPLRAALSNQPHPSSPPTHRGEGANRAFSNDSSGSGGESSASASWSPTTTPSQADDSDEERSAAASGLWQLVYTSSSSERYLPRSELQDILSRSRVSNAEDDLTGMLLYRDGSFAQFLEGPLAALERTFSRIQRDPRHRGVIVILKRPIARRDFSEWRMGFRDLDDSLKAENLDENMGQVGSQHVDQAVVDSVFDLTKATERDLTHAEMTTSTRTLVRVFHRSLSRPI